MEGRKGEGLKEGMAKYETVGEKAGKRWGAEGKCGCGLDLRSFKKKRTLRST